ncbi:MAG: response regulator SirA [Chloroflexi bacterium]|nr:response regulator SirA [Chloroflexota bacterium]
MPEQITKRSGAIVPFNRDRITNAIYRAAVAVGGRDRALAEQLADQVVAMIARDFGPAGIPTVEDVQNIVEKVLIENGHAKTAKAYILYREERAQRRAERDRRETQAQESVPWRKLWEVLNWAVDHDLHTIDRLNARLARGEWVDIVRESDAAYQHDIEQAAEQIVARREQIRVAIVAGPSSSGKTTTTTKLSLLLKDMGLSLVPLTVDNYFFDLELHPKDEHGDYDYETPQALDLELISQHLAALVAGERVMLPFYDFKTGRQHRDHTPMQLHANEIILIDSLHGLYAPMTADVPSEFKFRLYIEPMLQMKDQGGTFVRWTDLRLMRRMERDASHRAYDRQQTLEHWHYVRSSELRNIVPYINTADAIVNSALPYELPVMRRRLIASFARWAVQYDHDPLREDAADRAKRVYALLAQVGEPGPEEDIPGDSLLREFIGGSIYAY